LIDFSTCRSLKPLQGERKHDSISTLFFRKSGTGKTTVARIVADVFKSVGLLSRGHLVEVDKSKLVAGYSDQTAIKNPQCGG
jgi:replication-associated recombination protein RarA